MDPDALTAALAYAARDWAVLPIWPPGPDGKCTCGKPDCDRPGKHPVGSLAPKGVFSSTKDPDLIRRWWTEHPDANVGIATGALSNMDALDVDGDEGEATLRGLEKVHGEIPETPESLTGGGGRHVFFQYRSGLKNAVRFAPGLDLRTTGGYIVAPPSLHASGRRYAWDCALDPEDVAVAGWPEWLITMVAGAGGKSKRAGAPPAPGTAIPENQRNRTLTSLAGSMRCRGHTESEILAALLCTNTERCRPPLTESEVERIARSVASYEAQSELVTAHMTDLGNRDRLIACHGQDIRYHDALGWLAWTGSHWHVGAEHVVMEFAASTVRAIYPAASSASDQDRRQALAKHAARSESAPRIRAMVELARNHASIRVELDALDADPWLLCVRNGVVDLRTGELRHHRQEDLITRKVPIDYDPDARAPRWEKYLAEVQPNPEVRAFLQRFLGYVLTGQTGEQVFLILHGPGSNGKSVLVNTLLKLLGGYGASPPFTTFLQRRPDAPTNDLADLRGARLALASEPDAGARLSESVVKRITGQDPITARHHYKEFQTFIPVCKVVLVGNHKPRIRGTDNAIWRRVLLVTFDVTIPDDDCDQFLPQKLLAELSGILAWAVRGCLEWQRDGLRAPDAVRAATASYRQEEDHFGRFLEDVCEIGKDLSVTPKALREAYVAWCEREGEDPLGVRTVARRLSDRGFTASKSGSRRYWNGLGLARDGGREATEATPASDRPAHAEEPTPEEHEAAKEYSLEGEAWERWTL